MKIEWIPGAAVIALVMCGSMVAQDCGCNGFGNASGYVGSGRAQHAWTYDQALGLWDGYCSEQPACRSGCGLFRGLGCNTGCASRWPTSCSDCNSGCATGNGCGLFNFGSRGWLLGGGCGTGCGGSVLSRFAADSGCGCNGGGGFGFANRGCGCNDGGGAGFANHGCGCNDAGGCSGHRHGLDLLGGLRSRIGCGGCGLFSGVGACGGCDSGASSGCGCN